MSENSTTSNVIYKDLGTLGFDGYRVGDDGSVWSCWSHSGKKRDHWKQLACQKTSKGYPSHILGKTRKSITEHHLILLAFVGPCPKGMEARHLNGIKTDNRLENLAWGTRKENYADRIRHGTDLRYERNGRAVIDHKQVFAIRKLVAFGMSCPAVAAIFGISKAQVWKIKANRSWKVD